MTLAVALTISGVGMVVVGGIVLSIGANLYNKNTYESRKWSGILIKISSMLFLAAFGAFVKAFLN